MEKRKQITKTCHLRMNEKIKGKILRELPRVYGVRER